MKREKLLFHGNENPLTLGVELELQVLDGNSLLLTPRVHDIIDNLSGKKLKQEFFQSTLEVITGICNNVHDINKDFSKTLDELNRTAKNLNLKLSSTGTHPEADYRDRLVTPSKRYHELMDRNQYIIRRMAVYGMHIHVGMLSGDACIAFHNFFLHFVPHLIALSASSPFWQKMHTGLASSRPTMYEAMPTSGMPHIVKTWSGFENMYGRMVRTRSIKSIRDLWLDLRPSPQLGTLEIRICDEPATLQEALAITAFVHVLAHWYQENHQAWETAHKKLHPWIFRENKWRAIRYGLDAELVQPGTKQTPSIREHIGALLTIVDPWIKKLKYEIHMEVLKNILQHGNSADRQLRVFKQSENLHDVVLNNVREFENNHPNW
jgi:carboxylate-amine ligase